jgi:hypothetical protein
VQVYFRSFWRWPYGVVPMLRYSVPYHRHCQHSRGLLRALVAGQVYHWRDLVQVSRLRHRAYSYHRHYQKRLRQLHMRQGDKGKS